MFQAMKREGMPVGKAARISQAKTGLALMTGKPPKKKTPPKKSGSAPAWLKP